MLSNTLSTSPLSFYDTDGLFYLNIYFDSSTNFFSSSLFEGLIYVFY
jgi:hypothetical protein